LIFRWAEPRADAQEFRSDSAVVLEVAPDQPPACAAILEPQRRLDPDKWYSRPRYLSDLHAFPQAFRYSSP